MLLPKELLLSSFLIESQPQLSDERLLLCASTEDIGQPACALHPSQQVCIALLWVQTADTA